MKPTIEMMFITHPHTVAENIDGGASIARVWVNTVTVGQ